MSGASSNDVKALEFDFTDDDFAAISAALYKETGIYLPATKSNLVYARVVRRLRHLGMESFRDYCSLIESAAGAEERTEMMTSLTTNVTRFFREKHHFDHLKSKVLPHLLDEARKGRRVRIWSAGCSSGQEPYSIALTILSLVKDAGAMDVKILATDIHPGMLEIGKRGVYPFKDLGDVPPDGRNNWISKLDESEEPQLVFNDAVRSLISFRKLNLMERWPVSGIFDVIFCRNVVIYFDDKTQAQIWKRFASVLQDGGHLYIGHSERVSGPAVSAMKLIGTTMYRKEES